MAVMERGRGGGAGWAGRMGRGCSGASSLSQSGITAVRPQSSFTLTNEKPPRPHPRVSALLVHSPQVQPPLTPLPGAPVQGRNCGTARGPCPSPINPFCNSRYIPPWHRRVSENGLHEFYFCKPDPSF